MGLTFKIKKHRLQFKFSAQTSRGTIDQKDTWFIQVLEDTTPDVSGFGECCPLTGLSVDDRPDYDLVLAQTLQHLAGQKMPVSREHVQDILKLIDPMLPSIRFGVETALLDLMNGGIRKIFDTDFYAYGRPIKINGLVWMGDKKLMLNRLKEKIDHGFSCIKLKIGSLPFDEELEILKSARRFSSAADIELRVDANGAFSIQEVQKVLEELSMLNIHSIEQPISVGLVHDMAFLCKTSPIPIALDEELIGVFGKTNKRRLLEKIRPQYIILKPSLLGGFSMTSEWIELAEDMNIGWWTTSALESNIGLNAICQFTSQFDTKLPQGLGTGGLYKNNVESPLAVHGEQILYDAITKWDQAFLSSGFAQI
jgi:o-succinylbenzoate synthase